MVFLGTVYVNLQPGGISSVNDGVNQQMVAKRWRGWTFRKPTEFWICSAEWETLLLPLAREAACVVGVEGVPAACGEGREKPR